MKCEDREVIDMTTWVLYKKNESFYSKILYINNTASLDKKIVKFSYFPSRAYDSQANLRNTRNNLQNSTVTTLFRIPRKSSGVVTHLN